MTNDRQNSCLATVFLFYLVILTWSTIQSTFVSFKRISGARYTSELGTVQVNYEPQCVYSCVITPNCSSVSYDRTNKRCDLAAAWIDTEQTMASPDWEVLYRKDYPICSSGSCFKVNNDRLTWNDANVSNQRETGERFEIPYMYETSSHDYCQAQHPDGHLAHIKTEGDMTLLLSLTTKYVWIGALDTDTEGVFFWTDNTLVSAGYTNWIPGQPDDYGGEDCLSVSQENDNKWNDADCNILQRSVCQYPASTVLI